jgi:hypothetical protein
LAQEGQNIHWSDPEFRGLDDFCCGKDKVVCDVIGAASVVRTAVLDARKDMVFPVSLPKNRMAKDDSRWVQTRETAELREALDFTLEPTGNAGVHCNSSKTGSACLKQSWRTGVDELLSHFKRN